MNKFLFQYCPKIAVFRADASEVFLARRKGEQDYDGVFTLIGGKMEHIDHDITAAIAREKNEEVGEGFRILAHPFPSIDVHFEKKDGSRMILPHLFATYVSGEPVLSDEYSSWEWIPVASLKDRTDIVPNLRWIVPTLTDLAGCLNPNNAVEL